MPLNLNYFRDRAKGFPDLLNYASLIKEGVLFNKDGSLTSGFYYRAEDISSSTARIRDSIAAKMNQLLSRLGNGWSIHIDCNRMSIKNYPEYDESFFPDNITRLIDEERREWFEGNNHYESLFVITLTYLPPHKTATQVKNLVYSGGENEDINAKIFKDFESKVDEFESLASNSIKITRMKANKIEDEYGNVHFQDELLSYINYTITGNMHPVNIPVAAMYLDSFIGGYEFVKGVIPRIDNKNIGIVAIDGFPQESTANILDSLSKMDTNYRWNTRFIFLDEHEAKALLNKYRRKWQQKVRGFKEQLFNLPSTKVDQHAQQMVQQIDSALSDVNSGLVAYGYYSSSIIVIDEDINKVEHYLKEIRRNVEKLGFNARIEGINTIEAYLGSLPGHVYQNIRRPIISTFNLAHYMPLSSIWAGDKYCPNDKYPPNSPALMYTQTNDATPFRFNFFVDDVGHTLVFGPTGAGKSVLLATIVAQFRRYKNAKVFAFDKGNSLFALTKACNGKHFEIGADDIQLSLAPLGNINSDAEQIWAEDWISTCIHIQLGKPPSVTQKKVIHDAMIVHRQSGSKSITDFISNLQDMELSDALNVYSVGGTYGKILDGEVDDFSLSDFVTCELEHLMNFNQDIILPTLLYFFHRIEKALDGSPAILVLDEAWIMLGHEAFRNKIKEWLKVLRKANCAVILATQSLSDAASSGILDVLQEQCPTKVLLPNPEAFNKSESSSQLGPYDYYVSFGLNDKQISIISNATKKRDYYYTSALGSRLFTLALGKAALSFVASSSKQDIKDIKKLLSEHQDNWTYKWMEQKKVSYKKYKLNKKEEDKNADN